MTGNNSMTSKRAMYTNIIISIVFAAAMIGSAILIDNTDTARTVRFILIAVWLVPFFYLAKRQNS
ncbi:MAG: hypothetical protein KDE54_18705 [Caldilineaceae bacterium]|nr:hypothetical protein [Caldilineaceae bacterium]MCB0097807.1 hypothetical protein [Caldilineaceae bacterium]MCB0140023.1 hypothetical protein [Caldilineaceae bacterium]